MPSIQQGRITPGTGQITFSSGSTSTTTTTVSTTASSAASSSTVTFSVQNASSSGIGLYDSVSQTGNDIVLTLSSLLGDNGIVISETDGLITVGINNSSVAFTGGTINGVIIGGTTPAAGTFTNAQFSAITASVTPFPITGLAGNADSAGGEVDITAGAGGATGATAGGPLTIAAGAGLSGGAHGGTLTLSGGNANGTSNGAGGAVNINAGNANGNTGGGGAVTINAGNADNNNGIGGAIVIQSGNSGVAGTSGSISLTVGTSASSGASVNVAAGNGGGAGGAGGNINLFCGVPTGSAVPGQVVINSSSGIVNATYYFTGAPAATTQVFLIATRPLYVVAASEIHAVAAGGVSTLTVTHDTGTGVPGSGFAIMTGSFNLNATANTVQTASLASVTIRTLATGDRLSVNYANGIQASSGIVVSVSLAPQ